VVELGGTISGEHGIGLSKKPFMHYQFSPQELELFRRIKKVFDPLNLLNPGKMF
jgi:glycolate oxidase